MAERVYQARIEETGEERTIVDPELTEQEAMFLQVSDAIWAQKPPEVQLYKHAVRSVAPPKEALGELNNILMDIHGRLAVAGIGRSITLPGLYEGEQAEISAETLDNPVVASVGTFNWDERQTYRVMRRPDGFYEAAVFTDGHHDYYRELTMNFGLGKTDDEGRYLVDDTAASLTYTIQRHQAWQGNMDIASNLWYAGFAETGYEGNNLYRARLRPEQELRVLRFMAEMAGVALDDTVQVE